MMPRVGTFALILLPALAGGAPRRIAILPVEAMGADGQRGADIAEAATEAIRRRADLILAAPPANLAIECGADEACALRAGTACGADLVLTLRVAGLGGTHLVRARLYETRCLSPADGTCGASRELQDSVVGDARALLDRVASLVRALLPPPPPPAPAGHRRAAWWIYAAAGAAIAAIVVVPIVLAPEDDGRLDLPP